MLKKYNPELEKFRDDVNFSYDDPCIFVVYPAGSSGDLLASIINAHYLNTGADYFGINENGQVIFRPSDYNIMAQRHRFMINDLENLFTTQLLNDISESLGNRNLNYSTIDQMIFRTHMFKNDDIEFILNKFPKSKIIQIYIEDNHQWQLVKYQSKLKNSDINQECFDFSNWIPEKIVNVQSPRLLSVPYISLFENNSFNLTYQSIVKFLNLESRLIKFNYVKFYLKCQTKEFRTALREYKKQF